MGTSLTMRVPMIEYGFFTLIVRDRTSLGIEYITDDLRRLLDLGTRHIEMRHETHAVLVRCQGQYPTCNSISRFMILTEFMKSIRELIHSKFKCGGNSLQAVFRRSCYATAVPK